MKYKQEIGNIYGRLTVIASDPKHRSGTVYWRCVCECGASKIVAGTNLRSGSIQSCGCLSRENSKRLMNKILEGKDRRSNHPLYMTWRKMIDRCQNPKHIKYKLYGGRGIKVCHEWYDFWVFVSDMGTKPEGYTLERKNGDLGYNKDNCKWATYEEQNNNRRAFQRKLK